MKTKHLMLLAATAVGAAAADPANESLLNMLQKKGLLTEAEIKSVRQEQQAAQATAKPAAPNWSANTKISGDLRARFEGMYADDPAFQDRSRFRYRLRAGVVSSVSDKFEVGFRLISGENASGTPGGDPIGGNTSFQDNASKKLIFVDLAYAKWNEIHTDSWTGALTIGKMENPFRFSDLVFDNDYTPEGVAQQVTWAINHKQTASFNLGGFVLDGIGALEKDAFLGGIQFRLDSKWSDSWQTSAGLSGLAITGTDQLVNGAVPNQNRGNSRPGPNYYGADALSQDYAPLIADASATYWFKSAPFYHGRFPIKFAGDYMYNASADARNQATSLGVFFGKSGKKGQWDLSYRWKYLEGDAWYEELVDSDFGAFYKKAADAGGAAGYSAGTNVRGHVIKACYSITDSLTIGASAAFTELITPSPANSLSGFTRVQFDTSWKF